MQDPSYPVYVDTSVMMGQTGEINEETMQYDNIVYMPCKPSNDFFPDLEVGSTGSPSRASMTRKKPCDVLRFNVPGTH